MRGGQKSVTSREIFDNVSRLLSSNFKKETKGVGVKVVKSMELLGSGDRVCNDSPGKAGCCVC